MRKSVNVYLTREQYNKLEGFVVRFGFSSVYELSKASVLFMCRMLDNAGNGLREKLEEEDTADWLSLAMLYQLRNRERRVCLPSGVYSVHPWARRFSEEEYERLQASFSSQSRSAGLASGEDVLQNMFLYLYREGDCGCLTYEEYREKALRRFGVETSEPPISEANRE